MVEEFDRLKSLYAAQDANITTAFCGALVILLGYALIANLRQRTLSATLRRVYLSLVLALHVTWLIILMTVNWYQGPAL